VRLPPSVRAAILERAGADRPATDASDPFRQLTTTGTFEGYTGSFDKKLDPTANLIEMGARPYDPNLGRFLAVDPIDGGSLNNYDYAGQDPINGYDLSGDMLYNDVEGGKLAKATVTVAGPDGATDTITVTTVETSLGDDVILTQHAYQYRGHTQRWADPLKVEHPDLGPGSRLGWDSVVKAVEVGEGCWVYGSWGATWGTLTGVPGGTAVGAIAGCLGGAAVAAKAGEAGTPDPQDWGH
jgi:RHS repeat-associated protein